MYLPVSIAKFGEWFAIQNAQSDRCVQLINPKDSLIIDCIRKGRGPGEAVSPSSFHKAGNRGAIYDCTTGTLVAMRVEDSFERNEAVLDTIMSFDLTKQFPPAYLTSLGNGVIAGNLLDPDVWYSYYSSDGTLMSSLPSFNYQETQGLSTEFAISLLFSSLYASSIERNRVCVASVLCPSISFSKLTDCKLEELKRIELASPSITSANGKSSLSKQSTASFQGISGNGEMVSLLYSGKSISRETESANVCNHLVRYDWDGCPVHAYRLEKGISAFCIEGNVLYGAVSCPESRLYVYDLSK
ncbi:MAG: BF3164 family lipoprotein [Candidatus Cryptobacteroides sp.]